MTRKGRIWNVYGQSSVSSENGFYYRYAYLFQSLVDRHEWFISDHILMTGYTVTGLGVEDETL